MLFLSDIYVNYRCECFHALDCHKNVSKISSFNIRVENILKGITYYRNVHLWYNFPVSQIRNLNDAW